MIDKGDFIDNFNDEFHDRSLSLFTGIGKW